MPSIISTPETTQTKETRLAVLDMIKAKAKLKARQREEFLAYFDPWPGEQTNFFQSQSDERWAFGGNDSGKTTILLADCVLAVLGCHPFRKWTTEDYAAWLVSVDYPNSRDVVQDKLFKTIIPPRYIEHWSTDDQILKLKGDKGIGAIAFKSCDSGREKFQGARKDYIGFDEQPPKDIYQECKARQPAEDWRRLDIAGAMTPLKGMDWMYRDVYSRSQNDPTSGIECYFLDTEHNLYLSDRAKNKLKQSFVDEADIVSRIHGRFTARAGLILAKFLKDGLNIVDPYLIPYDWPRVLAIDPHPKNPSGVLFGAVKPDNHIVFYDEIYGVHDVDSLAIEILAKKAHYGGRWIRSLIDTSAQVKEQTSRTSVKDLLGSKYHIHTTLPNKRDKMNGIVLMQRSLVPLPWDPEPQVTVMRTCPKFLWEMSTYAWDEWKGPATEKHDAKEEPIKRNDHLIDAFRYILQSSPVYTAVSPTEDNREGRSKRTGY